MSDGVPENWTAANLGELCTFSGGNAFPEKYQGNGSGDYPFIKVSDMERSGNERFVIRASNWISESVREKARIKLFPPKSVVFAKVGAALFLNRRRILSKPTAIDNNLMAAVPKNDDNGFLYYLMQQIDLASIAQSGAVPSVNQAQMIDVPALIPSAIEQQKIATILSSVDDVIEKTRAQIDKLKDLKTGMMQELLTQGIGHTEFKDSPVGRIPASWSVRAIGDLGRVVTGSTPKTINRDNYGGSVPFVTPLDINSSLYVQETNSHLTEKGLRETREIPENSVCVVCIGSTIGKTGITKKRCATNQQVNSIICNGNDPEFVYYLLTYHSSKIRAEAGTQAVPIINKSSFSALLVQFPPMEEQRDIGRTISSVDRLLIAEERRSKQLGDLKKALMADLLTGKVRVNTDQKESEVA